MHHLKKKTLKEKGQWGDVGKTERVFSTGRREKLAEKGKALPGGGYPIPDVNALRRAVQASGRNATPERFRQVKAHIIRNAERLNRPDLIPDNWKHGVSKTQEPRYGCGNTVGFGKADDEDRKIMVGGRRAARRAKTQTQQLHQDASRMLYGDSEDYGGYPRYAYEPGRQRRLGGTIALTGAGGLGLAGAGAEKIRRHTWESMSEPRPKHPPAPVIRPFETKRMRLKGEPGRFVLRARKGPLAAVAGGGALLLTSRKLSHKARQTDREWY
jgi:hypothetical protein